MSDTLRERAKEHLRKLLTEAAWYGAQMSSPTAEEGLTPDSEERVADYVMMHAAAEDLLAMLPPERGEPVAWEVNTPDPEGGPPFRSLELTEWNADECVDRWGNGTTKRPLYAGAPSGREDV